MNKNNKSMIKMVSSKKIIRQNFNNKPVVISDNFSYNRRNNKVKILRNTKLNNKRRLLIAESNGGQYHLVERTINGNNKTNRAYKVSEESIPQFIGASVNSISNRKQIKKCSNIEKANQHLGNKRQDKTPEKAKKAPEKAKKAPEKAKKTPEKAKKTLEKAKKTLEKAKKTLEKAKKAPEKAKKKKKSVNKKGKKINLEFIKNIFKTKKI
jgi:hypothetical protein